MPTYRLLQTGIGNERVDNAFMRAVAELRSHGHRLEIDPDAAMRGGPGGPYLRHDFCTTGIDPILIGSVTGPGMSLERLYV